MLIRHCIRAVEVAFNLPRNDMMRVTHQHHVAHPRQAAMWLARLGGHSLPQIARDFGGRDHTTILHGIRAAAKRADVDEIYGDKLQYAWILLAGMSADRFKTKHGEKRC